MPCCILGAAVLGLLMRRRSRRSQERSQAAPVATWSYDDSGADAGSRATATASVRSGGA
jgi:hypothetical protein